jgi:hypothetical protein
LQQELTAEESFYAGRRSQTGATGTGDSQYMQKDLNHRRGKRHSTLTKHQNQVSRLASAAAALIGELLCSIAVYRMQHSRSLFIHRRWSIETDRKKEKGNEEKRKESHRIKENDLCKGVG